MLMLMHSAMPMLMHGAMSMLKHSAMPMLVHGAMSTLEHIATLMLIAVSVSWRLPFRVGARSEKSDAR